jgi:hypothetical protein
MLTNVRPEWLAALIAFNVIYSITITGNSFPEVTTLDFNYPFNPEFGGFSVLHFSKNFMARFLLRWIIPLYCQ